MHDAIRTRRRRYAFLPQSASRAAGPAPALLTLAALVALLTPAARAQNGPGDLLITPTRIVFEGRQRAAEITLVNTGSAPATYRISLVHLRMNEDGGTSEIETKDAQAGERFADALLRYSPRQVTLEPKIAQSVRMQLRKPATLEDGEYRSHLLFRAIPAAVPAEPASGTAKNLSVRLTPIYGISIPIIVRQGETAAQATLSDLALVAGGGSGNPPALRFRIHRSGNRSLYGNLTATLTPRGGKAQIVGVANGVAVYTPNTLRNTGLALHTPPGVDLRGGSLHLVYSQADKGNAPIAEAEILLP